MSTPSEAESSYYFITFGRKTGGIFDLLGLPPDAALSDVARASREYEIKLTTDHNIQIKDLGKKKKEGQITAEEFERSETELKEAKTKKLTDLRKMREEFERPHAMKKGQSGKARWMNIPTWVRMSDHYQFDLLKERLPILTAQTSFAQWELDNIQSPPASPTPPPVTFHKRLVGRQVSLFLAADTLWNRLVLPGRQEWRRKVDAWVEEARHAEPQWSLSAAAAVNFKPAFPGLCTPTRLSIDRLSAEELEDFSSLPRRGAEKAAPAISFEDFLKELLGRAKTGTDKPASDKSAPDKSGAGKSTKARPGEGKDELDIDSFLDFLNLMGKLAEQDDQGKGKSHGKTK